MSHDDHDGEDDLDDFDRRYFRLQADIDGDCNRGDNAGEGDDPAHDDHDEKDDQRQEKVEGTAPRNNEETEQIAVHGCHGLSSLKMRIEGEAMPDSRRQCAQSHCGIRSHDQLRDQNDKCYFQQIQSHGRQAGLFSQNAAGIAAAEIAASVLAHIGIIENLADHESKRNRSDQISQNHNQCKFH